MLLKKHDKTAETKMKKSTLKAVTAHVVKAALMCSCALILTAGFAKAQTYSRLISFGDSLSDNGNLFIVSMATQPPAPYNQRFTNQLVWMEYLTPTILRGANSLATTTGSIGYGFGGSRTDALATPGPGVTSQLNEMFLGAGGTFGANDVVSLWGGANDIFQGLPTAALNPSTASTVMGGISMSAAANMVTHTNTALSRGAKTVLVFNLPDLGSTPQFSGDFNASSLSSLSSSTFNGALKSGLNASAAANRSANIISVDVNALFAAALSNPQAFGFDNVRAQCLLTPACVTGGAAIQDKYLFWDGVHPTGAGHRLVAAASYQYLYTPTLSKGVGQLTQGAYLSRQDQATDFARRLGGLKEGKKAYIEAVVQHTNSQTSQSRQMMIGGAVTRQDQDTLDLDLTGFRAGGLSMVSPSLGLAVGGSLLSGQTRALGVSADVTELGLDGGLVWRKGTFFAGATVGYSLSDFTNYQRETTISALKLAKNRISVGTVNAGAQAGVTYKLSEAFGLTPLVRLHHTQSTMERFSETGALATVAYEERKLSATSAALELQGHAHLSEKTHVGVTLGYEALLSQENAAIKGKLIDNTANAFSQNLDDLTGRGVNVGVALWHNYGDFSLKARLNAQKSDEGYESSQATLSFQRSF